MSVVLPREMSNPPMDRLLQRKHNINTIRIILSRPLSIDLAFSGWSDDWHANLLSLENQTEIQQEEDHEIKHKGRGRGQVAPSKG